MALDKRIRALTEIRNELANAIGEHLGSRGFHSVTAPVLTRTIACESPPGSDAFSVAFFDETLYLSQSAQFYLEPFIYEDMDVYTIMPSFRREISDHRHLCEFLHLEVEKRGSLEELIDLIEEMVVAVTTTLMERCSPQILECRTSEEVKRLQSQLARPFARITYHEALRLLEKQQFDGRVTISEDDETLLAEKLGGFVFLTHFPKECAPFHHRDDPRNPTRVLNCNLLFPGYGEIVDGGERITDKGELVEKLGASGRNVEDYDWYVNLRELKLIPHIGFGMGVDRFIQWLLNLPHIQYATHFPRLHSLSRP